MLIWIFGLLDLFALFTLVVTHYGWIVSPLLIILTFLYLVGKGIIFFGDVLSILDVVIAFYFILFVFGITFNLLFYFGVILLLYKIIMSFTL
tara:strand:- start:500 stop:775 length:276 start_codon:yes stop_codon:yes gene_type:complete